MRFLVKPLDITMWSDKALRVLFCVSYRDNLLELRIYYESLTYSDVRQVPSYDLYSLLGKQHIIPFLDTKTHPLSLLETKEPICAYVFWLNDEHLNIRRTVHIPKVFTFSCSDDDVRSTSFFLQYCTLFLTSLYCLHHCHYFKYEAIAVQIKGEPKYCSRDQVLFSSRSINQTGDENRNVSY